MQTLRDNVDLVKIARDLFINKMQSIQSQEKMRSDLGFFSRVYGEYLLEKKDLEQQRTFYEELSTTSTYEPLREIFLEALREAGTDSIHIDTLARVPNRDGFRQIYD